MDLATLIGLLTNPPEEGLPETINDDLSSAYQSSVDSNASQVAEFEATIAGLNETIAALKSHNYDLLVSSQASPVSTETAEDTPANAEEISDTDDDGDIDVDDLFDNSDKEN